MTEWEGNYQGGRWLCEDCKNYNQENKTCKLIQENILDVVNVEVEKSNICKKFEYKDYLKFRITEKIDCKDGIWRYNDYIEWLMNDYYRPYTIDRDKSPLGTVLDYRGRRCVIPATKDLLRCKTLNFMRNIVVIEGNSFQINLLNYRNLSFIDEKEIRFDKRNWRKTKRSRQLQEEWYESIRLDDLNSSNKTKE